MNADSATRLLELLGPGCRDQGRRTLLLRQAAALGDEALNGVDFVEYERIEPPAGSPAGAEPRHVLHVHWLAELPADVYGLLTRTDWLHVHGGTRITGIGVLRAARDTARDHVLDVEVDRQGDFSPYLLSVGWLRDDDGWRHEPQRVDRLFSVAPVNFRPGCPVDFDCAPPAPGPRAAPAEPALDYLAKDYAGFRQLLWDLVAQRNPRWTERSPADLGITLLELFAYEADQLSYFQDAVANEAFLDTARQRVSAKRHARLVDYLMHDGRNAWTYAHLTVETAGTLPAGTQLLTRIPERLHTDHGPAGFTKPTRPLTSAGTLLAPGDLAYRTDPALTQVRVFETATSTRLDPLHHALHLHTWGNEHCVLAPGATTVHLYGVDAHDVAVRPRLAPGDLLLLEEVKRPGGHDRAADPAHRVVVRIEKVSPGPSVDAFDPETVRMRDPLFGAVVDPVTKEPVPRTGAEPALPLLEVTWSAADAPGFALCLSAVLDDGTTLRDVSVARGNVVAADHGRTVREQCVWAPPLGGERPLRMRLNEAPLTFQCEPARYDPSAQRDADVPPPGSPQVRERPGLRCDVMDAKPAVAVRTWRGAEPTDWLPVPDLLSSGEFDTHFVADVDGEGRAVLRFGDGQYGAIPLGADRAELRYRVGNGHSGDIGADALAHLVVPHLEPMVPAPADWPVVTGVRNPLPAHPGTDAETIEQVRQYAPAAFRTGLLRAVTEQDYRDAALSLDGVRDAVAAFRWTGSWYTACVGIAPDDPRHVLTDARGATSLDPAFRSRVHAGLSRFRLAGYDLEIRSARYVPLDLTLQLCAAPGYFRGDVAHAVTLALGAGPGPGGAPGLFHPAAVAFGQPVHLSRVYAAAASVEGVQSVTVTGLKRHGRPPAGELESGTLPIGPWEIARLDNDPSAMENGTLTLTAGGGS
ncbi:hypothetical protein [Streptomyces sp. NPDC101393]|uniref:hypothetical protein n=1 Tax=Streptomyces sp. NPDC101393 TaxID=3366141 RepID=UPI003825CC07